MPPQPNPLPALWGRGNKKHLCFDLVEACFGGNGNVTRSPVWIAIGRLDPRLRGDGGLLGAGQELLYCLCGWSPVCSGKSIRVFGKCNVMLDALFNPRTIAVYGASRHPHKVGHTVLKHLLDGGFTGRLIPINPTADEVLGLPCVPDIAAAETPVDLAILVVPPKQVEEMVRQALASCGHPAEKTEPALAALREDIYRPA